MDTMKRPTPNAPDADNDLSAEPAIAAWPTMEAATDSGPSDIPVDVSADDEDADEIPAEFNEVPSRGVGAGACAIVAAGLSLIGLSGSWASRVLAERQSLVGQIERSKAATPADQIAALYGDGWQLTALVNGVLATLALLIAAFVLALPVFGLSGRDLPSWVRAVSWAAVVLGTLGVLIFGFLYFLPLPKVPA
ncbi:hypothetical protein [Streptomyces sp. NPDC087297]|uniref:hypothetical protein n=1 Tax=Streptomyces sp. NPDC087297 TaxID=3365778 RepID=UPI0037FECA56